MANKAVDKDYLLQTLKDFDEKILSSTYATTEDLNDKISEPATEGTEGQVLTTDGNGNRVWADAGGGSTGDGMLVDGSNAASSVTFANSALTIGSRGSSFDWGKVSKWTKLTKEFNTPYEFFYGSAVVYNDKIYIIGGQGGATNFYSWDDINYEWILESTLPYGFSYNAAVVYNDEIHLLGFSNASSDSYRKRHYSWNGTRWKSYSVLPYVPDYCTAVVYNDEIHILGGYYANTNHYSWNSTTDKWTSRSTLPINSTKNQTVVFNNKIYLFNTNNYCYSWNGTSWNKEIKISDLAYVNGGGQQIVSYDNKIHILGGRNNDNYNYHCSWDGISAEVTKEENLPYSFDRGSAVVYHNSIHILGSMTSKYRREHYFWDEENGYLNKASIPYNLTNGEAVVYNNKIHILGGNDETTTGKYHYSWDLQNNIWTKESELPYFFVLGSAVVYHNEIHIFGGGTSDAMNCYHYAWDGTSWTRKTDCPTYHYGGASVVYHDKIYLIGGTRYSSSTTYSTQVYAWDDNGWSSAFSLYSSHRFDRGSAVVYDDKIYIIGGYQYGRVATIYDGQNCTGSTAFTPYDFYNGSAVVYDDKVYLFGGTSRGDKFNFFDKSNIFSSDESLPINNFYYGSAVTYNNKIYIMGGNTTNNFYCFDITKEIIEVFQEEKIGTITQGNQSMADGDYSLARGTNCLAKGNYSKAEGINAYSPLDFQNVLVGSSDKFDANEFAFGYSLYNHKISQNLTKDTPINSTYGCSGTIVGQSSYTVYFKLDIHGIYLIIATNISNGVPTLKTSIVYNTCQANINNDGTNVFNNISIYNNYLIGSANLSSGSQFAIIRLV